MRLSVTGITSGLGRRFAEVAIERGHKITGLVRSPDRQDARDLASRGARLIRGDLEMAGALATLCRDADAVLHLAAHVGDTGTPDLFDRVNVGGTRNTLDAAAAAGAKIFVHVSSTSVYGRPDRGRVTEEWPTRKCGLPYEDTKTEAERIAFARGRMLGIPVIAIRPPLIYGPHDRNFMPRLVAMLEKGRFLLVSGGKAPLNVVWVDHVVDLLLLAIERPDLAGEAFNVGDEVSERPPSVREVAETVAREVGLPPPRISVPYPLAMGIAYVVETGHVLRKAEGAPFISPFVVKLITRNVIYDAEKAVRLLGWTPRVRAIEGIARAARDYRASHAKRPAP
jgi:nucleoside-diphosphate-sugar epimerase